MWADSGPCMKLITSYLLASFASWLCFCIFCANVYLSQITPRSVQIACESKGDNAQRSGRLHSVLSSRPLSAKTIAWKGGCPYWRWTAQRQELWLHVKSEFFSQPCNCADLKKILMCTSDVHYLNKRTTVLFLTWTK